MRRVAVSGLLALLLTACREAPPRPPAQEVVVPAGDHVLAGSWRPGACDRAAPAVLLWGGSGPQDRDGTRTELAGYRPFVDLDTLLAASGIGVLRLDDRGVGASTGTFAAATTEDFARDARAALAWLRARDDVDPARVAMVGHSEGALVALLAAAADSTLAGIALLSGASRSGREVARWQRAQLVLKDAARFPPAARGALLAAADSAAEAAAQRSPWMRTWFTLDPRAIARRVRTRALVLHGATDRQVPVEQADELAAALREGGSVVSVVRLPATDHLLLTDHDGDPEGYARLGDRRLRREVGGALGEWLRRLLRPVAGGRPSQREKPVAPLLRPQSAIVVCGASAQTRGRT